MGRAEATVGAKHRALDSYWTEPTLRMRLGHSAVRGPGPGFGEDRDAAVEVRLGRRGCRGSR